MSSNTRTKKFEESVREGLEHTEITPEEFDREEDERRRSLARAFANFGDDAPVITPGEAAEPAKKKRPKPI